MDLTAIFESWHIGDGNYPPLHREQLVRLSFELDQVRLRSVTDSAPPWLAHAGKARYSGRGRVLRRYDEGGEAIAVIEAPGLRFYVHGPVADGLTAEQTLEFDGVLFLDHYLWVEFLDRYADPPDLFYNLRVTRIRRVSIPARLIRRGAKGALSYPTSVAPQEFGEIVELDTMVGQAFGPEFYVVDFSSSGLDGVEVPRTFQ